MYIMTALCRGGHLHHSDSDSGQVLRYSNIISDLEHFIYATKQLYGILLRRGYDDDQLKRKFRDLMLL